MPQLSVIVPLYNQEKYIKQCISSIQSQTIEEIEIIVVDDGSLDDSGKICDNMSKDDSRIIVIHQDNRGLAGARYSGILASNSEYITFVDADDFILPHAYDDALIYMNNDFDQIFYEISRYFSDTDIRQEHHVLEEGVYNREKIIEYIYPQLIWNFTRNTPGIECSQCVRIVKRELLVKEYERLNGNYFYYGEDIVISYPLFKKVEKLAVISKSYYMHRQRNNNTAPEYISSKGYFDEIAKMYMFLRNAMKENERYDFTKQIDYMYMYSVCLKKWSYDDYEYSRDFLFPFDKVIQGKRIILYGAGLVGKSYYKQLMKLNYCKEIMWVDRNAKYMNVSEISPISKLEDEESKSFDNIVIAIENRKISEEIKEYLINLGYHPIKIII